MTRPVAVIWLMVAVLWAPRASAQILTQRGFADGRGLVFPQEAPNDHTRLVGDLQIREELFVKPAPWVQFAGGVEVRANSHDQVDADWRPDFGDRGVRRARVSVRRATGTIARGPLTLDVGKQFIRWGQADIVNPTDRLAPRDFLNVVDNEVMAVTGVRAMLRISARDTLDVVWVPRFTPSRVPLLNQRWTVVPPDVRQVQVVDGGAAFPEGTEEGIRWSRTGTMIEYSVSVFNGFNHLPTIDVRIRGNTFLSEADVVRIYPPIRSYGGDAAVPTRWFTLKGEAAYFTSSSSVADEYVLYVIQLERQTGEWVLVGGYAGEIVADRRTTLTFAPDRGLTKAVVGRVSYTIDSNRNVALETAVRQNLDGLYVKAEYSHAHGQHWRATVATAVVRGDPRDFLGQYRRNSDVTFAIRYSF